MLNTDRIKGSGFTMIVQDDSMLYDQPQQTQKSIDEMFVQIISVLKDHNFSISIVAENTDAMRLQGKLYIADLMKILDKMYVNNLGE